MKALDLVVGEFYTDKDYPSELFKFKGVIEEEPFMDAFEFVSVIPETKEPTEELCDGIIVLEEELSDLSKFEGYYKERTEETKFFKLID